jgi:glycosyltransferase involved in cell wall biosynthesis
MERWQFFLRKLHFSKVEAARVKARNIRHYFSWHHLFLPLQHELESANIESKPAGASIETAGGTSELKVSVLMPAFNAEQFIRDAIESILAQTFRNFEFIIIDDGSSDHTSEIIKTFKDSRIRFHRNKKNLGIVRTLNKGLALAKGKYIARMDADDISLPERLAKQVEFMDQNPEIVVSGGAIEEFSIENSRPLRVHKMPEEPAEIRALLLFQCVLMHPTIIMRRSIIASEKFRYSPRDRHVEDFGMWQRISFSHCLANLPDVLLKYRLSPQSITHLAEKKVYERDQAHIAIYQQALNRFNVGANKYELTALRHLIMRRENISIEEICAVKELLKRMRAKLPTKLYDLNIFNDIVARKFLGLLWTALPDGNVRLASEAIAASALFRRYSIFSAAGIVQRCDCYILKAIIGFALRLKEQLSR